MLVHFIGEYPEGKVPVREELQIVC